MRGAPERREPSSEEEIRAALFGRQLGDEHDLEEKVAYVTSADVDYYTDAQRKYELKTLTAEDEAPFVYGDLAETLRRLPALLFLEGAIAVPVTIALWLLQMQNNNLRATLKDPRPHHNQPLLPRTNGIGWSR